MDAAFGDLSGDVRVSLRAGDPEVIYRRRIAYWMGFAIFSGTRMTHSHGYAALSAKAALVPFKFERRDPGSHDVKLDILYCGICHSDLFFVDNDWGMSVYPMVPGHEIVGRVVALGKDVKKFKVGDIAAIGCIVDSCRRCEPCTHDQEHMCAEHPTPTYAGFERGRGLPTFGGYSNNYVADEAYVVRVPRGLDPARAAPLDVRRHHDLFAAPSLEGGAGHESAPWPGRPRVTSIKLAKAMGAAVVVFTTSRGKIEDARSLGADEVVVSSDADQMAAQAGRLDFILDTVSAKHDLHPLLAALRNDCTLCLVGAPAEPLEFGAFALIVGRKCDSGIADRRHRRDAGYARFLRPPRGRRGHRADLDEE